MTPETIRDLVKCIEEEVMFLPAIQRKFVWGKYQISQFFDSIMKNYPIGTFLFWYLDKEKANSKDDIFYHFLQRYNEREPYNKVKTGAFLKDEIIGVLDGQQRISSLYIGLQGIYQEKLKYAWSSNSQAYPETMLFLDLLNLPYSKDEKGEIIVDEDEDFDFSFLTAKKSKDISKKSEQGKKVNCYWFKVGEVLKWSRDPSVHTICDSLIQECEDEDQKNLLEKNKDYVIHALTILHKRIVEQPLINSFPIKKDELDDILKIFVRVNSGGTVLSKTDLLFSTIIATWEQGRDEIENFIKDINEIGNGFRFDNDFIMRCCLVLTDLDVLFKVRSFRSHNVIKIKNAWLDIHGAITKTVQLISDFGFNGKLLTSQNSIIIIAYYILKGGNLNNTTKKEIHKYLLHSLLKNVYGGQGDQVIKNFRNTLRIAHKSSKDTEKFKLRNRKFSFSQMTQAKLPSNKSLDITIKDIEEFMTYRKGPDSFFVLSLLYSTLRYRDRLFHQDHIHPDSGFTYIKLANSKIPEKKWNDWRWKRERVPNLQLMDGTQNESKNKTPYQEWLLKEYPDESERKRILNDNYIPKKCSLEFKDFEDFYKKRETLLIDNIKKVLKI